MKHNPAQLELLAPADAASHNALSDPEIRIPAIIHDSYPYTLRAPDGAYMVIEGERDEPDAKAFRQRHPGTRRVTR